MNNYIRVDIETNSAEQIEILIAELSEIKFYAFQEDENVLNAYIKEEDFDEALLNHILPKNLLYKRYDIAKINWNKKWEDEFMPVIIDDFAAIRAAFHLPVKNVKHDIIITPKMSFGTGHHSTTSLMIREMERIDFKGKSVLDFGTGTGILSILAEKLGAHKITAIDTDDWSIENAKENFKINYCNNIDVFRSGAIDDFKNFDVILANINLSVIISNMDNLKKISHKSTRLLLSGFLQSDEKIILQHISSVGFICNAIEQNKEWICIHLFLES